MGDLSWICPSTKTTGKMCLYLYSFQNPNMGPFGRIICTILLNFFYVKYTYMPMALGLMGLICGAQTREGNDSAVHTLYCEGKTMSLKI